MWFYMALHDDALEILAIVLVAFILSVFAGCAHVTNLIPDTTKKDRQMKKFNVKVDGLQETYLDFLLEDLNAK